MVGEKSFIFIYANTISLLEIVGAVIVWRGVSETALFLAHARFTGASLEIEVIYSLLFATFCTSLCIHR